jgi:MFS superfamily sulfate permease-like transporter/carbonic anhydrase/acetyltransferase-like protein (isoleucine patch superfamily)
VLSRSCETAAGTGRERGGRRAAKQPTDARAAGAEVGSMTAVAHGAVVEQPGEKSTDRRDTPKTIAGRLKLFFTFFDSRFEDLDRRTWKKIVFRDFSAGLVVALTAIPMAMGFAMAMGLRPEQGIIAGALACAIGRTFGGSKYQVYGPTAAFIPLIASIMTKYGEANGGSFASAHGMLVFVSIMAGIALMICGVLGLGKVATKVPASIIVGFTVGIAVTIALSNGTEALGIAAKGSLGAKLEYVAGHLDQVNGWAFVLAALTFVLTKVLLRISIFIPAPLIALAVCTGLTATVLDGRGISVIHDRFGSITNFFVFTPPVLPELSPGTVLDVLYFAGAIVFVSGVESLLCSSMADRLANNKKTPFNSDKEFWGQGLVQIITPLINGFPCTGALARTATSIKAGAVTPLAGYFKFVLKLAIAYFLASYLERVPLACIAGILLWVATNMVNKHAIMEVIKHAGGFHVALMIYTAVMVPATDFLTAVLSALILFAVFGRFFKKPAGPDLFATPQRDPDLRAVLAKAIARGPGHVEGDPAEHRKWLGQIRERPLIAPTAYVHPAATIIGRVVVGDRAHIAADTSVRADEGSPFHIGANTNIQDGVVMHALKDKRVMVGGEAWAIYVGREVSIAHEALVHGPCYVGDKTFIGFKAVVHDAVVGSHCFIGIGAVVVGVEVPDGRFVPHGRIVDSPEAVAALPLISDTHRHFNEDVVEVNRGLAVAYQKADRDHVTEYARRQAAALAEPDVWDIKLSRYTYKERF